MQDDIKAGTVDVIGLLAVRDRTQRGVLEDYWSIQRQLEQVNTLLNPLVG
jgi:hypothetical protein